MRFWPWPTVVFLNLNNAHTCKQKGQPRGKREGRAWLREVKPVHAAPQETSPEEAGLRTRIHIPCRIQPHSIDVDVVFVDHGKRERGVAARGIVSARKSLRSTKDLVKKSVIDAHVRVLVVATVQVD